MVDFNTCVETKAGTLLLPKGRLSYPNLFVARAMKGEPAEKAMYGTTILLPGSVDLKLAIAMVDRAVTEKWGAGAKVRKKPFLKSAEKMEDEELAKAFPIMIRSSSKQRPGVIFANCDPCTDEEEVYPGRWARLSVRAYCWDHPANGRGVSFGLSNVQLLDHDERIGGGRAKAEDEFSPVEVAGGDAGASADSIFGD
jgi:hypothetical protein